MAEPTIVPRAEHTISRRDIDPDALKVLYRLHEHNYVAYLVGGSVRDLLLEPPAEGLRHRHVGTSVPGQEAVSQLLDHRPAVPPRARQVRDEDDRGRDVPPAGRAAELTPEVEAATAGPADVIATRREPSTARRARGRVAPSDHLIHRDNTYGTPEEDAFRRDFTVNALFYDIGTFSIIDYVGGLEDLDARLIRCIGDPDVRFLEDPVRMLRAVVLAARLEFTIDQPMLDAIPTHRHEIARSAPARLVEEFYKILRSGHAEEAFRQLRATGLLKEITPELPTARPTRSGARLPRSIGTARGSTAAPESLTNAILAGTLLVAARPDRRAAAFPPTRSSGASSSGCCRSRGATSSGCSRSSRCSRGCSTSRRRRALAARAAAPRGARRSAHLARDPRRAAGRRRALARAAGRAATQPLADAGCGNERAERPSAPHRRRRRRGNSARGPDDDARRSSRRTGDQKITRQSRVWSRELLNFALVA